MAPFGEGCDGGALVVIRIEGAYIQDFRNAISRYHSVLENFNGRVLGIAESEKVSICESGIGWWVEGRNAVCILSFKSVGESERWCHSMPQINQPDFLHGIDIAVLPTKKPPPELCGDGYVVLSDHHISRQNQYIEEFEEPAAVLLKNRSDVTPGVVATEHTISVRSRDGWVPSYVVVHFFKDKNAFSAIKDSADYRVLRDIRSCTGSVDEVGIELGPLLAPPSS